METANMQTLFWSLLNIPVKFHQNDPYNLAIPFQSWCVFETQYIKATQNALLNRDSMI